LPLKNSLSQRRKDTKSGLAAFPSRLRAPCERLWEQKPVSRGKASSPRRKAPSLCLGALCVPRKAAIRRYKSLSFCDKSLSFCNESLSFCDESLSFCDESLSFCDESLSFCDKSLSFYGKSLSFCDESLSFCNKSLSFHDKSLGFCRRIPHPHTFLK